MWRGAPVAPSAPSGVYTGPPSGGGGSSGQQKHDIFVGNLAFNTTEEQLHQAFSEIGRVLNVRLVTDLDTGKPRGFAFVEFENPEAALAAIRNMNDYELNGRRLRVNFSNSSHLEDMASKLGMDFSAQKEQRAQSTSGSNSNQAAAEGTSAVATALKGFSKGEVYDVVAKLKEIAEKDTDEARRLISGHPQLPEALLYLMSQLDMIKTPVPSAEAALPVAMPPAAAVVPVPTSRPADPRQRAADPRRAAAPATARVDPRQRMDPRQKPPAAALPPPPPPRSMPPPPRSSYPGAANLDPTLVQQVMSLTPQMIQQLPPDKQQSILQLRQQITGRPGM